MRCLFLLLTALLIVPTATAVAISTTLDNEVTFTPGNTLYAEFTVRGTLSPAANITISADDSELSPYITFSDTSLLLSHGSTAKITMKLNYPASFPTGYYPTEILFKEQPAQQIQGSISTSSAAFSLNVIHPPEDATLYYQLKQTPNTLQPDEPARFSLIARNIGHRPLENGIITATIYHDGTPVHSHDLTVSNLAPLTAALLNFSWTPPPNLTGTFDAKFFSVTNNDQPPLSASFVSGTPDIQLGPLPAINANARTIELPLPIELHWAEPIQGMLIAGIYDPHAKRIIYHARQNTILAPGNNLVNIDGPISAQNSGTHNISVSFLTSAAALQDRASITLNYDGATHGNYRITGRQPPAARPIKEAIYQQPRMTCETRKPFLGGLYLGITLCIFIYAVIQGLRRD